MVEDIGNGSLKDTLDAIGKAFHISGTLTKVQEIEIGHINRTYRVFFMTENEEGTHIEESYLFQWMNTYVFKKPEQLMENIEKVTAFIREHYPEKICLRFLYAGEGNERKNFLIRDGEFWRVCVYIPSVSLNNGADLEVIRRAGEAFGDFQRMLSGFDASLLYETIPNFHNTLNRYRNLTDAAEKDLCGRKKDIEEELAWLLSVKDQACLLAQLQQQGKLPLRVTHNDTKINNVLFDEETMVPLAVIDLDTVMPGYIGADFGDAVRSSANLANEDCRELEKVRIDLEIYRAFAEGFLSKTAGTLTELETETLADACFSMTVENAVRFLEDHLRGDVYFRVRDALQNLDRARCQIRLAQEMQKNMDEMHEIVRSIARKYR